MCSLSLKNTNTNSFQSAVKTKDALGMISQRSHLLLKVSVCKRDEQNKAEGSVSCQMSTKSKKRKNPECHDVVSASSLSQ